MVDRNEIWGQAYELGNLIAESPEVEAYKLAKNKMESNPQINSLLKKLRDMQQEYDKLREYSEGSHLKVLEDSISETLEKLDEYPDVIAFKETCTKVDELLQAMSTLLANCISGQVNDTPYPKPSSGNG